MNPFPEDTLTELKVHLEEEKARLLTRIDELNVQDPFRDPERTNDNAASDTEANEESNHDRVAALVEESKKRVEDIDNALGRIKNGTYGFCSVCGAMIDTDRLSVVPTATLCLTCEQSSRGKGGVSGK